MIEVDIHFWNQLIKERTNDLMFNSDYLKALAESFNIKVKYFILKEKDKILLASAVFINEKDIVLVDNYTYHPLWIEITLSERKRIDLLLHFIQFLKENFRKIDFKLNPNLFDIRPFKWSGFDIDTRYTYLRKKDSVPHKTIKARFLRVKQELPEVFIDSPSVLDIQLNMDFLRTLNFSEKKIVAYQSFLSEWNNLGFLKSFSIKNNGETECSYLVLLDSNLKKAYTLMINGAKRNHEFIHALIYQKMLIWLDENNFEETDFCGANMEGISKFKSFFNPELQIYFLVRYSPVKNRLFKSGQQSIVFIKRILKFLKVK